MENSTDKYIGRILDDRYELIGSGGMANVYKALCHRLNRYDAVKIMRDETAANTELRRRFRAESQAVAMLSHPNIVSVYDVSHSDDVEYIVMELIDGITLKQYLQKKSVLEPSEVLDFTIQIAKALEHAHSLCHSQISHLESFLDNNSFEDTFFHKLYRFLGAVYSYYLDLILHVMLLDCPCSTYRGILIHSGDHLQIRVFLHQLLCKLRCFVKLGITIYYIYYILIIIPQAFPKTQLSFYCSRYALYMTYNSDLGIFI